MVLRCSQMFRGVPQFFDLFTWFSSGSERFLKVLKRFFEALRHFEVV